MRPTTEQKSDDLGLQRRLIHHYSRMADWLDSKPWYRDNNVTNIVCSLLPRSPSRVLELCCGTGLLLEGLSNIYPRTEFIGVDISPRMVERARERLFKSTNVVLLKQDWVYQLASEFDNAFDVIIVKNGLHVLHDVITKLKDLRRVSHDWTVLIIVETVSPNVDANELIKRLFQFTDPEHLKQIFFTEKILSSTLREAAWFRAQYKPRYVRQHIETEDWLKQRCADRSALESARKLLSETRNLRVRQALDFDTDFGVMPSRMLRLQYVARHVFAPAEMQADSQASPSIQLQLL